MPRSDGKVPATGDRLVRRPEVEWVELDGEVVAYDPKAEQLHRLNPSAARVWAACDGSQSEDELVEAIQDRFVAVGDAIDRDVRHLLRELARLGLVHAARARAGNA